MKRTRQLLGAVSSVALIALSVSPAYAAGTTAGVTITNEVTVDYKVGGFDQTQQTATNDVVVDRKINLAVTEIGNMNRTDVSPNQTQAIVQFKVTNLSNDVMDMALTAVEKGGGTNLTNIKIYSDTGVLGVIDGSDAEITYLDEVAVDTAGERNVIVTADIPITAASGATFDVVLTATAHVGGAAGLGVAHVNTSGAATAGVDTVFADTDATAPNTARDGKAVAEDGYVVKAAALSAYKTSIIISDPINGTNDPKAIPGAIVEYCIIVANGEGATHEQATGVVVKDPIPSDMTYVASSLYTNSTVMTTFAGGLLSGGGCAGGTQNTVATAATLSSGIDVGTLASGATWGLRFRATIN